MVRRHLVIRGRVQGVSYRWATMIEAERVGATGWVRNRPDGSVEAEVEGSPDVVEQMVAWAHQGSEWASVESVDVTEIDTVGSARFQIRD